MFVRKTESVENIIEETMFEEKNWNLIKRYSQN